MQTAGAAAPAFAIDTLEFDEIRQQLARHTSFSGGQALALGLEPTSHFEDARRRQSATAEALQLPGIRPGLHLGGVHDVRPLAARAQVGGILGPEELLDVASTVRGARTWRRALAPLRDEAPTLLELSDVFLSDHPGLAEDIQDAIGEAGEVLDSASPALGRIRTELRGAHDRLVTRLRELMSSAQFRDAVQDPVVTQRAGRYVIPVRAEFRGSVPGIVHDQSASGATLFVEPLAVVEMGNRWRTLRLDEEREVERILAALSMAVGQDAEALTRSVEGLAQIDLARASAGLAEQQRGTAPELVRVPRPAGQPVLKLNRARHPLLRGSVVPITLELGGDFDVLLITGPNTGGKTVALKTAGLLSLMAMAGLFVPADEGSLVAVFERVQADIGDEQSLQQSLSTFSGHVSRIVRMLRDADSCSLILLDELGAGTDPREGAALARALLDFLIERKAYVVATTHYPVLKSYADATERV
jgi:DNA mismatch repair protein MutS2